ncbi:hypothetical protein LSH36_557g00086 [Paralvinella palmiformis]|uniref:Kaptin n=1 Tax=Paralvinella palmiformis TaxID=53620 RepID=A0AAD9J6F5_9ANNE|nr:hypothetical protein LSH36_557g00086 [Paralvinella palmiformis]
MGTDSHQVLHQPPSPTPATKSYISHQVLHQPPGPTPATRSYTSHQAGSTPATKQVLHQPPGPTPTTKSYTNHQVLHQRPSPISATKSYTSHQVLHQPQGPTPTTKSYTNHQRLQMNLIMSHYKLQEALYCNLASQSNIYCLTKFVMPCGVHKILVASLQGEVISLKFQKTKPISREVHFTYIPGDAEIVSIDAFSTFSKKHNDVGIQIGISFIKHTDGHRYNYLNIYSEWEKEASFDLDRIARIIFQPDGPETVFLLSGGDQKIHLFREVEDQNLQMYVFSEEDAEEFFPEFVDLPSSVACMQCQYMEGGERITLLGCLDGTIRVSTVKAANPEIIKQWTIQHDSPITALHLFNLQAKVTPPDFINQLFDEDEENLCPEEHQYNLLVASALEKTVVYRDLLNQGLAAPLVLPGSDNYDSILCALVADLDFDGQNEILLGSYGQELLAYKFHPHKCSPEIEIYKNISPNKPKADHLFSTPLKEESGDRLERTKSGSLDGQLPSPVHSVSMPLLHPSIDPEDGQTGHVFNDSEADSSSLSEGEFKLEWQRTFPDPVLAMDVLDITGDGLNEIIVVSQKGVHILQHKLPEVAKLCMERLQQAQAMLQQNIEDDAFQQLLTENIDVS